MRNTIFIYLLLSVLVSSCGPFQKALKNDDIEPKYKLASEYYEEGIATGKKTKLKKSLRLLEQILPQFRGKPQAEYLAYISANSQYHLKNYFDSGYQFERFVSTFPASDKAEDAAFKAAMSYYHISPRYSLDQRETVKALEKFEQYLTKFPSGDHVVEANQNVTTLHQKLEEKNFKIAELYYLQDDYKAAVSSLNNFINENPGSEYREKAYYYKMDAEYTLAVNSFQNVMKERLENAQVYSEDYLRYFPDGEYVQQANKIITDVEKRLEDF